MPRNALWGKPTGGVAEQKLIQPENRHIVRKAQAFNGPASAGPPNRAHTRVLHIWARAGKLASDGPAGFFPEFVDGPLKIELDRRPGLRVLGEVVDAGGKPDRASVAVFWELRHAESTRVRFGRDRFGRQPRLPAKSTDPVSLADIATNAEGRFSLEGLWPGERYHLTLTAEGYETHDSTPFTSGASATFDAGRLVIRRNNLSVEGMVLDSDGKPVAGASVYNSGDSTKPLTAETDSAGRFRFSGLFEGPVSAVIRKPGYWPAGLRCAAGDVDQHVRLIEDKLPRPKSQLAPLAEQKPMADGRELALGLLSELWKRRGVDEQNTPSRGYRSTSRESAPRGGDVVRHAARVDFRQTLKWSAEEGGAFDEVARIEAFDSLVHNNIDLAIVHADWPHGFRLGR